MSLTVILLLAFGLTLKIDLVGEAAIRKLIMERGTRL